MLKSIFETQHLLNTIDKHIANSHYKVEFIIKELGITQMTYYRKLKARKFSIEELLKIFGLIYPDEYNATRLSLLLDESIQEDDNNEVITATEFFNDYDRRYLS